jgi:uncharacterized protein (DUF885 family)
MPQSGQNSRRTVLGALGASAAMPFLPSVLWAKGQTGPDASFAKIAADWLDQSMRLSPVSATWTGDHRFDHLLNDYTPAGRAASLSFAKSILTRLNALAPSTLSRANQVDRAMLVNALESQIWTTETLEDWAWNPLLWQDAAGSALYTLMARDFAPLPQRLNNVTARLKLLPGFLANARENLVPARVPTPHAVTYAAQNQGLKSIITDMIEPAKGALKGAELDALNAAIAGFLNAIDIHQSWIDQTLVPAAKADFRAGAARFDKQLTYTLLSPLSRQEIRRRAEQAVRDVRADMYAVSVKALSGRADAPPLPAAPTPAEQQRTIRAALDLAAADRPARDKLVEVSTEATEIARKFVVEKDLITLPNGPVRIILMPEFQRGFSVAYCDSPGPLEKHLDTFYAVSPIPDDWTEEQAISFTREYNRRGIQDIAVHEAMPGHYVQIFHANSYPSILRAVLSSGSFVEGWAVYAETVMVEEGFMADDPLYRLTQLKVLLRTITNAIIDQGIHVDGWSEAQVMTFLTETAFQEEREAAGKWRRAQLSVTQLSTYFVGFAEHMETRAAAKAKQGAAFKLKAYHDGILGFGSPPVRYARALLLDEAIG